MNLDDLIEQYIASPDAAGEVETAFADLLADILNAAYDRNLDVDRLLDKARGYHLDERVLRGDA